MKRVAFMIIPALICGMIYTGCGKDEPDDNTYQFGLNGTYSGTVTTICDGTCGSWFEIGTTTTTISFNNGRYTCTGSPTKILDEGFGSYTIENDKIIFSDEEYFRMDFDGLPLDGEFNYTINGNNLKLTLVFDDYRYEFDLEKEE